MHKLPPGTKIITNNRLAIVWRLPNGDCRAQGKRVGKDCRLPREARRFYVETNGQTIKTVRFMMDRFNMTLDEAWGILKASR